MENKLISIVMSTYNGSKFIEETLKSVLLQTYINFEFIIINDCSNDNTEEKILNYMKKDTRIVYLKNKKNLGLTKSLNKGIQTAKGEYIARIDDNDLWDESKLQKQISFLEKKLDYGIVGTNFVYIDESGKKIGKRNKIEKDKDIKSKILRQNPFIHMSVLFRKKIAIELGIYDEKCIVGQDYDLWLRFGLITKMYNIQEFLTYTRLTKNGISAKNVKKQHKLGLQKCIEYRKKYPNFLSSFFYRLFFFLMPKPLFDILIYIKEKLEKRL